MTFITLTALGHAVHPYLQRIAENADHARDAARALTDAANRDANPIERLKG
jgi:DNA-binding transcriptional LysR family regulator